MSTYVDIFDHDTKNRHVNYRDISNIKYGVIHWWGTPQSKPKFEDVVHHLCTNDIPTSAHMVVEAGRVATLANYQDVTYHAGVWDINTQSLGFECNPRMSDGDFQTLAELIADVETNLGISLYLIGHRDCVATECPGTYYDRIGELVDRVNAIKAGESAAPAPLTDNQLEERRAAYEKAVKEFDEARDKLRMLGEVI